MKKKILATALLHFDKYGFENVSLRKIAAEIGISVGNLYNYFQSKDALFRATLSPFLRKVEMFKRFLGYHTQNQPKEPQADFGQHLVLAQKIAKFVHKNRQMISLLLFHSKGSSLADFADQVIDFQTQRFHRELNQKAGAPVFDSFFAHNLVSYFYNTIREGLMHELSLDELKKQLKDMMTFSYLGVIGLAQKKVSQTEGW